VANILAHATTVDGHLEINFANDTLVVFGLTRATLSADDLLLLV
jgi:hypothetical protein